MATKCRSLSQIKGILSLKYFVRISLPSSSESGSTDGAPSTVSAQLNSALAKNLSLPQPLMTLPHHVSKGQGLDVLASSSQSSLELFGGAALVLIPALDSLNSSIASVVGDTSMHPLGYDVTDVNAM